jgi:NAD(P)-dependent dehydrogenase (short-subunit alcohol dehydrogenase family)
VNNRGRRRGVESADASPPEEVVAQIEGAGRRDRRKRRDVTDRNRSKCLVDAAIETFAALHGRVNNVGMTRGRVVVNMSEQNSNAVTRVHLRAHFCPALHAAEPWRPRQSW